MKGMVEKKSIIPFYLFTKKFKLFLILRSKRFSIKNEKSIDSL